MRKRVRTPKPRPSGLHLPQAVVPAGCYLYLLSTYGGQGRSGRQSMHSASDDWITGIVYSRPGNEQAHSTTLKNPPKIASIHTTYEIQSWPKLILSARASARTTRQHSSTFIQYPLSLLSAAVTSSTMSQDTGLWSVRRPREVSTTRLKWPNLFVAHWREQQLCPQQHRRRRHPFFK